MLQLVATETNAWCTAWGMTVGLGTKKTELVALAPRALSMRTLPSYSSPSMAPLLSGSQSTATLASCCVMTSQRKAQPADIAGKLSAQWRRYFHSSRLIRYHSPALILQLFKLLCRARPTISLPLQTPRSLQLGPSIRQR